MAPKKTQLNIEQFLTKRVGLEEEAHEALPEENENRESPVVDMGSRKKKSPLASSGAPRISDSLGMLNADAKDAILEKVDQWMESMETFANNIISAEAAIGNACLKKAHLRSKALPIGAKAVDLRHLSGDLDKDQSHSEAAKVLQNFVCDRPGSATAVLLGVSGCGKTKAAFDVAKCRHSIFLDFSTGSFDAPSDIETLLKQLREVDVSAAGRPECQKHLNDEISNHFGLLLASRVLCCVLFRTHIDDDPERWLRAQLESLPVLDAMYLTLQPWAHLGQELFAQAVMCWNFRYQAEPLVSMIDEAQVLMFVLPNSYALPESLTDTSLVDLRTPMKLYSGLYALLRLLSDKKVKSVLCGTHLGLTDAALFSLLGKLRNEPMYITSFRCLSANDVLALLRRFLNLDDDAAGYVAGTIAPQLRGRCRWAANFLERLANYLSDETPESAVFKLSGKEILCWAFTKYRAEMFNNDRTSVPSLFTRLLNKRVSYVSFLQHAVLSGSLFGDRVTFVSEPAAQLMQDGICFMHRCEASQSLVYSVQEPWILEAGWMVFEAQCLATEQLTFLQRQLRMGFADAFSDPSHRGRLFEYLLAERLAAFSDTLITGVKAFGFSDTNTPQFCLNLRFPKFDSPLPHERVADMSVLFRRRPGVTLGKFYFPEDVAGPDLLLFLGGDVVLSCGLKLHKKLSRAAVEKNSRTTDLTRCYMLDTGVENPLYSARRKVVLDRVRSMKLIRLEVVLFDSPEQFDSHYGKATVVLRVDDRNLSDLFGDECARFLRTASLPEPVVDAADANTAPHATPILWRRNMHGLSNTNGYKKSGSTADFVSNGDSVFCFYCFATPPTDAISLWRAEHFIALSPPKSYPRKGWCRLRSSAPSPSCGDQSAQPSAQPSAPPVTKKRQAVVAGIAVNDSSEAKRVERASK